MPTDSVNNNQQPEIFPARERELYQDAVRFLFAQCPAFHIMPDSIWEVTMRLYPAIGWSGCERMAGR